LGLSFPLDFDDAGQLNLYLVEIPFFSLPSPPHSNGLVLPMSIPTQHLFGLLFLCFALGHYGRETIYLT
jgi:hypothetical protein